jgi:DNA polymerase-3 subunit gamma/tau
MEMVLLRMLAFRPADMPIKAAPQAAPEVEHRPAAVGVSQARQALADSNAAPALAPIAAVPAQTTRAVAPAPNAPERPPESAAPVQLSSGEHWHGLVAQMRLGGIASQLAKNCEFESWDGQRLRLRLDPACEHMRVPNAEQRLQKAVRDLLGEAAQIELMLGRPETETPARRDARRREERQQDARRNMQEDPLVQSMQETFDAELILESVKPIDR